MCDMYRYAFSYHTNTHPSKDVHVHCVHVHVRVFDIHTCISFEAWAELAQKWLVCVPLRIHLKPIKLIKS